MTATANQYGYWSSGNFSNDFRAPAQQAPISIDRSSGREGYGYQFYAQGSWGRADWNKWAWNLSCLRTDGITVTMWSPSQLGSALKGWVQGDHLGGADGSAITSWHDDSGGTDGATLGNDPDLAAAFLNNLNVAKFTGANLDLLTWLNVSSFTEGAVFFVAKANSNNSMSLPVGRMGTAGAFEQYNRGGASSGALSSEFLSNAEHNTGAVFGDATPWHILGLTSKASDWRCRRDGLQIYSTATNTVAGFSGASLLGRDDIASPYFDGYLAEVIVTNAVPSLADQQNIEGYLAWKWGLVSALDAGHPYKSAPPSPNPPPVTYNVSCLASCTPAPSVLRATAKPLATASTLGPALVRSTGKPLKTTSTPAPALVRSTGKPRQGQSTPAPSLVRSTGKPLSATSTPVPLLSRAMSKALAASSTPVPTLVRSTGKPLRTTSTPAPSLALARIWARSLLTTSTPVPTLQRSTAKPLQTATTPAPVLSRAMSKSLLTATTLAPSLSRQLAKSLRVTTTPVPTLASSRIYLKNLQAVVGAVAVAGTGPRVTAFFMG